MNVPAARPRPPQAAPGGSLWLGFGLGWLVLVAGYIAVGMILYGLDSTSTNPPDALIALMVALPWIAMIGLMVGFTVRGKPRVALGMLVALGSMVGLVLLLVAACFGLFAVSGMH
ncbi:MAG: hypothetical protein ABI411_11260 [Tahibacter sp.]